jgi:hypothetical protein
MQLENTKAIRKTIKAPYNFQHKQVKTSGHCSHIYNYGELTRQHFKYAMSEVAHTHS